MCVTLGPSASHEPLAMPPYPMSIPQSRPATEIHANWHELDNAIRGVCKTQAVTNPIA